MLAAFFWQVVTFCTQKLIYTLMNVLIKQKLSSAASLSKKQPMSKINNNKKHYLHSQDLAQLLNLISQPQQCRGIRAKSYLSKHTNSHFIDVMLFQHCPRI